MKRLKMSYPVGDQMLVSVYNFMLVFVPSLILGKHEFVTMSFIALFVVFVININNAFVYQPYLKFIGKDGPIPRRGMGWIMLNILVIDALFILVLLIYARAHAIDAELFLLMAVWIVALSLDEFLRRVSMVEGHWGFNCLSGIVLNLATWGLLLAVRPQTSSGCLWIIDGVLILVNVLLIWRNRRHFARISGDRRLPFDIPAFFVFGRDLLGAAVAFWFISGGYLFAISHFITTAEIADIRIIQNFFSGSLLILTVLDNYVLSGYGMGIVAKFRKTCVLLTLMTIVYGGMVYVAVAVFYPHAHVDVLTIAVFTIMYLLITNIRVTNSVFKYFGKSKAVFYSQFMSCILYLVLVFSLPLVFHARMNLLLSTALWIPSFLPGLLYVRNRMGAYTAARAAE